MTFKLICAAPQAGLAPMVWLQLIGDKEHMLSKHDHCHVRKGRS